MFMHGGLLHLLGNMLFLWIFGNNIEDSMGRPRFIVFYLAGGLAALAAQTLIDPDAAGFTSEDMRLALAEHEIESRPVWKPMHLQPVFAGARSVLDGTSKRLFETGLSLPSGSGLTEDQVARIDGALEAFLTRHRVDA